MVFEKLLHIFFIFQQPFLPRRTFVTLYISPFGLRIGIPLRPHHILRMKLPQRPLRDARRLLTLRELPPWMRDNDYLRGSYRPPQLSLRACFRTAFFTLNNDTVNVWSHCVGFFVFLFVGLHILGPATSLPRHVARVQKCAPTEAVPDVGLAPRLHATGLPGLCAPREKSSVLHDAVGNLLASHRRGMLPLLVTALLCLAFSTIYHAFWVHSPSALVVLGKLDFLGISLLCCGHGISGVYHLFYCMPRLANIYYSMVVLFGMLTVPAILSPRFSTPKARPVRTAIFCTLGSVTMLPLLHAAWLHSAASYELWVSLGSSLAALGTYALGAIIYVSRFPECCRVGKHDRFFASHQLMHVAVLFGVGLHLWGCWTLFEYRMNVGCSASPLFASLLKNSR